MSYGVSGGLQPGGAELAGAGTSTVCAAGFAAEVAALDNPDWSDVEELLAESPVSRLPDDLWC